LFPEQNFDLTFKRRPQWFENHGFARFSKISKEKVMPFSLLQRVLSFHARFLFLVVHVAIMCFLRDEERKIPIDLVCVILISFRSFESNGYGRVRWRWWIESAIGPVWRGGRTERRVSIKYDKHNNNIIITVTDPKWNHRRPADDARCSRLRHDDVLVKLSRAFRPRKFCEVLSRDEQG